MHVAEFSVRRWQFTLVVFAGLALLGLASLRAIPKAEDPTFPYPIFAVVAVLPGATPGDVERLVVDPLEVRLHALDDVVKLTSSAEDGVAVVEVEFAAGADPARKRDDVLREVTALRPLLPAELARVDVQEFDAADVNVLQLAVASDTVPYRELGQHARALKVRLEGVPGVGEVALAALPEQEVRVALDPERLAGLELSPAEVIAAIGAESAALPAGAIDAGARQLSVKTSGEYASVEEIGDTVVRTRDGASVRVRDLADVELRDAEPVHLARVDGKRAVLVTATMKTGQNVFAVTARLRAAAAAAATTLPRGVELVTSFDQSTNVAHRLSGFERDLLVAIALVLVTLLPLGLRASVVVMVSIPLSLAIGVTLLRFTGWSINQLSIVGFVIALGLLVDDSVVVVENVTRHLRLGRSPRDAAIVATRQITASVLGCTATLVFAFLPLLAIPGASGLFVRSMPVAIVFTVLASLVVSLTIVPFLSSRLLRSAGPHGNLFFRGLTWLVETVYRPVLAWAMARPRLALAGTAAVFVGSLALVPAIGFSLFPKSGIPQFLVDIDAAEGASLAETDRAVRFVEATLRRHPEVVRTTANVGKGNPRVYYNVPQRNERSNVGEVLAELSTRDAKARAALFGGLRAELAEYPGATIQLKEFANGPPVEAAIAIRVLCEDAAKLAAAARRVEEVVAATEGTRFVRNPGRDRKVDLRVRIDRERARLAGVAVPDVDRAVRLAVGGVVAGSYREDAAEDAWDVRVTGPRPEPSPLPGGPRPGLDALERLYLPAAAGPVPLAQVADLVLEPSRTRVVHTDEVRSTTITADVREGFNTHRLTRAILARLAAEKWPDGVEVAAAGEYQTRQRSLGGLGTAFLVAAIGVLAVLVLEFRTFRSTLIVASVIPLGVIGGLVALFLSGDTLSFTAMIGFVALMGIEVKNSILLVDFTNQLRAAGVPLQAAVRRAGETRFVPILLTTLTALGGLVPLALERSALYSPLALVIIGGLLSSTFLARVVTPVLYELLPPEIEGAAGSDPERAAAAAAG